MSDILKEKKSFHNKKTLPIGSVFIQGTLERV